ncbi:hypothetical protein SAMN04489708_10923 [Paracidovorax cattleyae]|uniref:Uncharacterized protein n=1 Tax=Paracidovorax cattleyae TaxID=80868 RepID=A0A1H0QXA2_9BURK|nr:hypothetical protein SAMN04489708_10923 [Paracidovorax cattleyae]
MRWYRCCCRGWPATCSPPARERAAAVAAPGGLGPRLADAAAWKAHLLHRLDEQIAAHGDAPLQALRDELAVESFFPADDATREALARLAAGA